MAVVSLILIRTHTDVQAQDARAHKVYSTVLDFRKVQAWMCFQSEFCMQNQTQGWVS